MEQHQDQDRDQEQDQDQNPDQDQDQDQKHVEENIMCSKAQDNQRYLRPINIIINTSIFKNKRR